ncbi:UbiA family prenyltransferase [Streptomyces sp. NPDC005897]|uniref:UbiA family prenyltransferase n=1 Tax=Streptomyces sp. NPDC005897 TaxID=3157081 RepID=UPI0033F41947
MRREVALSWRLVADNLLVALPPTVLFAAAAATHNDLPTEALMTGVGKAAAVGLLALYVFEYVNQIHGGTEDAYNKPYRPIPAGLTTAAGLTRRLWLVMPIYTLLGWAVGALPWVLLWQATVMLHYRWGARYYLWWKPFLNCAGLVFPLATGWQVTAPLNATAWLWILVLSPYFTLAMIYEDVRDMEGDEAVGRRTPALVLGPTFVRWWFAAFMVLLPFVFYFTLASVSGSSDLEGLLSAAVLGTVSWTCAARALLWHGRSADRLTFQLHFVSLVVTLATAPLLLARA